MTNNKKKTYGCTKSFETDLGSRALNKQHGNRTMVIPKVALENCDLGDCNEMLVTLVQQDDGQKFIKIRPKSKEEKEGEK